MQIFINNGSFREYEIVSIMHRKCVDNASIKRNIDCPLKYPLTFLG